MYFIEPLISRQKIRNNNEHGSARWSSKKEIEDNFHKEEVSHINTSGFPVYYSKNNKNYNINWDIDRNINIYIIITFV